MALGRFGYVVLAMAFFEDAIKTNPKYFLGFYSRSSSFLMMQQYVNALPYFEKAIELEP